MAVQAALDFTPTDLATAHALIASLAQRVEKLERTNVALKHELNKLVRQLFGKKTEKLTPQELQLVLDLLSSGAEGLTGSEVEADSGEAPLEQPAPAGKKTRHRGRRPFPKHLERKRVVIDLPESEKVCRCGACLELIGEDVTEKLGQIPAKLFVTQTAVLKYACPQCRDGVVKAEPPVQAVEKGLAEPSLLAQVVVSKYGDHLPLHRQQRIYARVGVDLSRSTLCGFIEQVDAALMPIWFQIKRQILSASYLQTDDTPVTVLELERGSFKGRIWTYLDPLSRLVVYDATRTHEGSGPGEFLRDFHGYLQADAYNGYDALFRDGTRIEVGCWAHARRRFKSALDVDQRAGVFLGLIVQLFKVEEEAKELGPEERLALRRERSAEVLARFDEERIKLRDQVLPKSLLADALGYVENQRRALGRFLEDGRLVLDNNGAERQLRAVAVGRKNWLFAGSFEGAARAARLFTLIESCRLAGVNPHTYLSDVLIRVATHPQSRIAELVPAEWARRFDPAATPTPLPAQA